MGASTKKVPVAILGATGSVGQRFIELLNDHPWFEIATLSASEKSSGKAYGEAVKWLLPKPLPKKIASMIIQPCKPNLPCRLVFSALETSVAGPIEQKFAEAGYCVISNASHYRMHKEVPLLIPEVNSEHLEALKSQNFGKGMIVTNPNCCVIGLSLVLKPLYEHLGLEKVHVVTMQAISGAGYPGVSGMEITDNLIPYIQSEEQKIETEPLKILGNYRNGSFEGAAIGLSAHCNRVPISDGHTACISLKFKNKPTKERILKVWESFYQPTDYQLHSSPKQVLHYFDEPTFPQPRLHREIGGGMAVSIGRLRECPIFDYKCVCLSHNTIRGAAGGALLCGELLYSKGIL